MSILGPLRWSFLLDFGSFRDLQRHRYMILPDARAHALAWLRAVVPRRDARVARGRGAPDARRAGGEDPSLTSDPLLRQYYVAMGYRVGCYATMGLPAFAYFAELRSGKTIHPTLREVVLRMIRGLRARPPGGQAPRRQGPDGGGRRGAQNIVRRDGGAT